MNKQKFLSYAVVGLMLMNIALMAFLFFRKPPPPRGHRGGHNDGPKKMVIKRLGFDAEQSAEFEKLIDAHKASIANTEKSIRQSKDALFASIANPNDALKDSLINRLGELQRDIERAHYTHFIELKSICRPDQIDEFNQFTKQFSKFFDPKRGKRK